MQLKLATQKESMSDKQARRERELRKKQRLTASLGLSQPSLLPAQAYCRVEAENAVTTGFSAPVTLKPVVTALSASAHPMGQYAWHRAQAWPSCASTPWMRGWLSMFNVQSGMVKIQWDVAQPEVKAWGGELTTLSLLPNVESSDIRPDQLKDRTAVQPSNVVAEKRRVPTQGRRRRLSLQLYDNFPTDQGTLADLQDNSLPWYGCSGVTQAELSEAAALLKELYLASEEKPIGDGAMEWTQGLSTLLARPTSMAAALERPAALASEAVRSSHVLDTATVELSTTPYSEGICSNYPVSVVEALGQRGVDVLTRVQPTAEALVAGVHLAGGSILRVPNGREASIKPSKVTHPAYATVHSLDLPTAMQLQADKIEDFLDTTARGQDGKLYSNYERLSFKVKDSCAEASIYVGVCSGHKKQEPLSYRVGQYDTQPRSQFSMESQLDIKRQLMVLLNDYIQMAEDEAFAKMPVLCAKQARLREILSKHPVYLQNVCQDNWFASMSHPCYLATGMKSRLFTTAYVSIGSRTRGCHTDYRNSPITHLSTRLRGHWAGQEVTGQTVLCDRYATRAIIIQDSLQGRQLIGGLNGIKHANFGPNGDLGKALNGF